MVLNGVGLNMEPVLRVCNISKSYGSQQVLKSVNFEVQPGEIHGLVGENGAGKSTLLNILFGKEVIQLSGGYSGDIFFNGEKVHIQKPGDAISHGIGMVHQEFALIPNFTITENTKIGRENVFPLLRKLLGKNFSMIDYKSNQRETREVINRLGISVDVNLHVFDLSVSLKQFIELAREISKNELKLLILDEPTAVFSKEDADSFLNIIKELSAQGMAVIFVSHRLEEVISICNRVTVLRDGSVVSAYERKDFNIKDIAESMVGHIVSSIRYCDRMVSPKVLLDFKHFAVNMPGEVIKDFDLQVYEGEILGIAGLAGHGKLALGNGVMGIYPSHGDVRLDGCPLDTSQPAKILQNGIYVVPDERREAGLLMNSSIFENIIFTPVQHKNEFLKAFIWPALGRVDIEKSRSCVEELIEKLDIRCKSAHQKVKLLSGGNQQKVCLARAVAMKPRVLFIAEPSRGVDIGAKEKILQAIITINRELDTTIIIASSELDELKQICDRIVIMYEGIIYDVFPAGTDEITIAMAFSGKRLQEKCYA